MSDHIDTLDDLNKHIPLKQKLVSAHQVINVLPSQYTIQKPGY
jgi:hypothetical protein